MLSRTKSSRSSILSRLRNSSALSRKSVSSDVSIVTVDGGSPVGSVISLPDDAEVIEELESRLVDAEEALASKNDMIKTLEKVRDELESNLTQLRQECDDLQESVAAKDMLVSELRTRCDLSDAQRASIATALAARSAELDTERTARLEAEEQLRELQVRLEESEVERAAMQLAHNTKSSELEAKAVELEAERASRLEAKSRKREMRARYETSEAERAAAEKALAATFSEIEAERAARTQAEMRTQELEVRWAAVKSQSAYTEEALAARTTELEAERASRQQAKARADAQAREIKVLTSCVESLTACLKRGNDEYEAKMRRLATVLETSKQTCGKLRAQRDQARERAQELEEELADVSVAREEGSDWTSRPASEEDADPKYYEDY
ncbi:hypothetical protein WOLCODRAFT_23742 [Wolfiporia cocos MD-104 SS10]|uniref:Uncharacterized protein n=1 Tax=Wolfiporia cocos (strain MD-104) TaxID=742152 RepID=A0A2H3JMC0_WOLCO|nr:hypothetical protein WOLCODRAFT_23742 [Wolfiporia cocos MD-104 SS10]